MSDNNSNSNIEYNFYDKDLFLYIFIPVSILISIYALYYIFFTFNEYKAGVGIVWFIIFCCIWIPYGYHRYNINQHKSNQAKAKAKSDELNASLTKAIEEEKARLKEFAEETKRKAQEEREAAIQKD